MILADKIIKERKKNNWSQEELAEKMNVSRQAVSKWESAQATPDIEKILQLASLFGVTTDYLLKDDIETEEYTGEIPSTVKKISLDLANKFLEHRKKASILIAIATFMCIVSFLPLVFLSFASELSMWGLTETVAVAVGLAVLFVMVACAVAIFIYTGFKNDPYKFIDKDPFEFEYGVTGMVRERQKDFRSAYIALNIVGTCLCVISPLPLILAGLSERELLTVAMLCVTMVLIGIGSALFIIGGVREASFKKLLKEGEFSEKGKKKSALEEAVGTFYWVIITAIYLAWSFIFSAWHISWVIWPISAVLFSGVCKICQLIIEEKRK